MTTVTPYFELKSSSWAKWTYTARNTEIIILTFREVHLRTINNVLQQLIRM